MTEGEVEEFTTQALVEPLIESETAYGITPTSAQFSGLIDPESQNTVCEGWQWVDEEAFDASGYAAASETFCGPRELGGGNGLEHVASGPASPLKPNTTYHFRAVAENASSPEVSPGERRTYGPDATFVTPPYPPQVSTGGASAVTTSGATIAGSVDPGSVGPESATTYFFQYGTTTNYGAQAPLAAGQAEEGESGVTETVNLTGLQPATTYHYRIVASNDNAGTPPQFAYGTDATFTTTATPPVLSGVSVSAVTQSAATIVGTLEPNGLPTRYELRLGGAQGLLRQQALGDSNGTGADSLSLPVEGLSPGTTYFYSLTAVNVEGTAPESSGTFTTSPTPAPTILGPPVPLSFPPSANAVANAKTTTTITLKTKALTRAQKLSKALKTCKKDHKKSRRHSCEKQARKRYGPVKH
jgi:hypothetical protein